MGQCARKRELDRPDPGKKPMGGRGGRAGQRYVRPREKMGGKVEYRIFVVVNQRNKTGSQSQHSQYTYISGNILCSFISRNYYTQPLIYEHSVYEILKI